MPVGFGRRIDCTAVQNYGKYRKMFSHDMAQRTVRFEPAGLDAVESFAKEMIVYA